MGFLNALRYCLRQTLLSIARNFWLATASAAMITVSLLILGSFALVALNAGQFLNQVESEIEINVFLRDTAQINDLGREIRALPGVERVSYIAKEQALDEMRESLGERRDILVGLEEDNPLPNSYRVRTANAEVVPAVAGAIEEMRGVEKVRYGQGYVEKLIMITRWVNAAALFAAGLLALAAVFLIMTTIRFSVMARRDEVEIMKYMGASNWFVRFPFLLEGMVVGFFGSSVAVLMLGFVYYYLLLQVDQVSLFFIQLVTDQRILGTLFGGLFGLGVFIGGLASSISIRKFLRV
ncbi:MAG: ABC transporter permease [Desulforudis sp.]|jgi:cell division transport system permease protein|nr:permease-like cell division protein FtsX [Clostridia bacterium]MDQ7792180.1 permease-like cell division protein FtsX [Clostridia bacterium]RJX21778.1 MAG: ABC transporter permease [Desulforudis sp.]